MTCLTDYIFESFLFENYFDNNNFKNGNLIILIIISRINMSFLNHLRVTCTHHGSVLLNISYLFLNISICIF